jgi:protease-4
MNKGNTSVLLAIQNGFWFIEKSYADAHLPLIHNILKGDFSSFESKETLPGTFAIDPTGAVAFSPNRWEGFDYAKPGSVAVLPVTGAIMKYDYCGAIGTQTLVNWLKQADANSNIVGVVLKTDSPGGTVAGTQDFANAVKAFSKPIITYVDDLMASAALWGGINADEIYAGNKTARIGSIGTMLSFADVQPMYEKQGIVFHEIYADASSEKNKDYNDARKGNYERVKETLNAMNDEFVAGVIEARGEKLDVKKTTHGAMFMASDAEKFGLIDGILSFEGCVDRVLELASQSNQNNQSQKNNSTMKIKATWLAMTAFLTAAFTGFKAEETALTEEHLEKMNAELATLAAVKTELATKETALAELTTAKAGVDKDLVDSKAETARVAEEFKTFKASNPGATPVIKNGADAIESDPGYELTSVDRERIENEKKYGKK